MQISDQGMHPLVEQREMSVLALAEIVGMKVPASEVQRHHASTGLDQPSRHQKLFEITRGSVSVVVRIALAVSCSYSGIFLGNVQCLGKAAGSQDLERLAIQRIMTFHHTS